MYEKAICRVRMAFRERESKLLQEVGEIKFDNLAKLFKIPFEVNNVGSCRLIWDIPNKRFSRIMIPLVSKFGARFTERLEL